MRKFIALGITAVGLATLLMIFSEGQKRPQVGEKVLVRLGWLANANSAGQIIALHKGFYSAVGLKVELREGGLSNPSVSTVANRVDDIGFANSPALVIAAHQQGVPLKLFGVVHERGYHAFFSKKSNGIIEPVDWPKQTVGIKHGSPTKIYYETLVRKLELDRNLIQEIPIKYSLQQFLNGEITVYPGALTNEYVYLVKQGIDVHVVHPESYGVETIGNVMFIREDYAKQNEVLLKRFLAATMKGWSWARENPKEATSILVSQYPKLDYDKELLALKETLKLVGSGKIDRFKLEKLISQQLHQTDFVSQNMANALIHDFK